MFNADRGRKGGSTDVTDLDVVLTNIEEVALEIKYVHIHTGSLKKNGTRISNYSLKTKSQKTFILFCFNLLILYAKYENPQAQKYQVRQTDVNNDYIIVNKNFIECIINLYRFRFFGTKNPPKKRSLATVLVW